MRFSADELLVPLIPLFGMLLLTSATHASESIPAPILSLQIHKCCTVIESAFAQINRTRMFSVLGRRSLKFCPSSYERPSITNAAITVPRTLSSTHIYDAPVWPLFSVYLLLGRCSGQTSSSDTLLVFLIASLQFVSRDTAFQIVGCCSSGELKVNPRHLITDVKRVHENISICYQKSNIS